MSVKLWWPLLSYIHCMLGYRFYTFLEFWLMKFLKHKNLEERFSCLRHSESSSHLPQKVKNKFNRKFVKLSKDARYNAKYLPVTKQRILSMEQHSIYGKEFFFRSRQFLGKSNSERFMELQIYYHIYKSKVNQPDFSHTILRPILILYSIPCLDISSYLFLSGRLPKVLCAFFFCLKHAPPFHNLLFFITQIIFADEQNTRHSPLCHFLEP